MSRGDKKVQQREQQQQKYEITVEPTVYYARFMIYLCSETPNRVDKQRQKALIFPRINSVAFRMCDVLHI